MRSFVWLLALLVVGGEALSAEEPDRLRFSAGGGLALPMAFLADSANAGFHGQLGVDFPFRAAGSIEPRLTAELAYAVFSYQDADTLNEGGNYTYIEMNGLAMLAFGKDRRAIRPFVVAGFGLAYADRSDLRNQGDIVTTEETVTATLTGGGGLELPQVRLYLRYTATLTDPVAQFVRLGVALRF